jgi:hypothetical protein
VNKGQWSRKVSKAPSSNESDCELGLMCMHYYCYSLPTDRDMRQRIPLQIVVDVAATAADGNAAARKGQSW